MLQPNKYADHIALHQKCLDILSMREDMVKRLNTAEDNLARWDSNKDSLYRLMVDRETIVHDVEIRTKAVNRITEYYDKHARKVCAMLTVITKIQARSPRRFDGFLDGLDLIDDAWMAKHRVLTVPVFGDTEAGIAHAESYGTAELNSHKLPCDFCVAPQGSDFSIIPINLTPDEHIKANPRPPGYC